MDRKVAAVIVTYNRKKLLIECVQALLGQSIKLSNITIIDNASTDGTRELLESTEILRKKNVNYIKLSENIGGAGGFYEGLKLLREDGFEWIWIMDDDTIPCKNALEELLKANEIVVNDTGKNASFLASSIYGEEGEFMNVPEIDNSPATNGYPHWYSLLRHGIVSIKNATFVSILVNGDAIEKVGLPCREYFIWGDDSEYTERLVKFSGRAYMVGKSIAIHKRKNARSLSILNENSVKRLSMYHYMFRNQLINILYYYGRKAALRKLLSDLKIIIKGMKKKLRWKIAKQILLGDIQAIIRYKSFANYIDGEINTK